jgi:hypothetical protein
VPANFLGGDLAFPNKLVERRLRNFQVGSQLIDGQDIAWFFICHVHLFGLKTTFDPECIISSQCLTVIDSYCQPFFGASVIWQAIHGQKKEPSAESVDPVASPSAIQGYYRHAIEPAGNVPFSSEVFHQKKSARLRHVNDSGVKSLFAHGYNSYTL